MSLFIDESGNTRVGRVVLVFIVIVAIFSIIFMAIQPIYNVWAKGLSGKAQLREAEWNRQIASLDAQAEIERAKGVAQSNQIIAEGLKGNEEYLRYLWIQTLDDNEVIYVPTEANLPILEARDDRT